MCWEIKVTLIGIVLTFIIGVINIIITLKQSNKSAFINTITIARKEYFTTLREYVAKFCAIAVNETQNDNKKLIEISLQLKMMMNPASYIGSWDDEAIELIDKIVQKENKDEIVNINRLIALMQSWLALEWFGITNESKKGILNNKEKKKMREKFYLEYQKYLMAKGLQK